MGNATKHSPPRKASPVRNTQSNVNRINRQLTNIKTEVASLKKTHDMLLRIFGRNHEPLSRIKSQARILLRRQMRLQKNRNAMIRYQLERGFPRAN